MTVRNDCHRCTDAMGDFIPGPRSRICLLCAEEMFGATPAAPAPEAGREQPWQRECCDIADALTLYEEGGAGPGDLSRAIARLRSLAARPDHAPDDAAALDAAVDASIAAVRVDLSNVDPMRGLSECDTDALYAEFGRLHRALAAARAQVGAADAVLAWLEQAPPGVLIECDAGLCTVTTGTWSDERRDVGRATATAATIAEAVRAIQAQRSRPPMRPDDPPPPPKHGMVA